MYRYNLVTLTFGYTKLTTTTTTTTTTTV